MHEHVDALVLSAIGSGMEEGYKQCLHCILGYASLDDVMIGHTFADVRLRMRSNTSSCMLLRA